MDTKVIPFSQLARKENEAFRKAFDVETKASRLALKADFELMDPDWIRLPSGRIIAFMESNGYVITLQATDPKTRIIIKTFFDDYDEYFVSPEVNNWETFGGKPEVCNQIVRYGPSSDTWRIAYRGGSGYMYGINIFI